MINHGYAPAEFFKSSMLSLPKGARADLSNSDMYRSITISMGTVFLYKNLKTIDFLISIADSSPVIILAFTPMQT